MAGFIASALGDDYQAYDLFRQALNEALVGGVRPSEARARRVLAYAALVCGDTATALEHLETATQIAIDEANDLLRASLAIDLSTLLCTTGSLDEASERIREDSRREDGVGPRCRDARPCCAQ